MGALMDWHRRLYRDGYIALAWPKEWAGAGAGLVEQVVHQDEMSNRGLPPYSVAMQAITLRNGDPSAERDRKNRRRYRVANVWKREEGERRPRQGVRVAVRSALNS
jgi:alkylation response protein AidB-like acyl-CoA dehydrogenase